MFILKAQQVKPCLLHATKKGKTVTLNGVVYRRWLFVEGESFTHQETAKAFKRVQAVLEEQKQIPLLLDDGLGITLYYYQRPLDPDKDIKNSPYRRDETGLALEKALNLSLFSSMADFVSLAAS
jgi:hypothetical protein